jgi:hypothetical protein
MPGLDPGIHAATRQQVAAQMDCRVKPGNDGTLGRRGLVAAATITAAAIVIVGRRCGVLLWRRGRADADDLGLAFDHLKDLRAWRELADIDLGEVTESGERLARPAAPSRRRWRLDRSRRASAPSVPR